MSAATSVMLRALATDENTKSGWVKSSYGGVLFRLRAREAFVYVSPHSCFWIREDGTWWSGYLTAGDYDAGREGLIDRWRLRRAIRAWAARRGILSQK